MDDTKIMTDTLKIKRAITGLTEWQKHVQTGSDIDRDISVAVEVLKAQLDTDVPDTNVGDTISRQAAIDAMGKAMWAKERLAELPSVQSIIKCKECKYAHITYGGEVKYCDIWFPDESHYIDTDNYCSFAERKDDVRKST